MIMTRPFTLTLELSANEIVLYGIVVTTLMYFVFLNIELSIDYFHLLCFSICLFAGDLDGELCYGDNDKLWFMWCYERAFVWLVAQLLCWVLLYVGSFYFAFGLVLDAK